MDLYARNETFTSPEWVGAQTDALQSGAGNGSLEASNITSGNDSTHIPQRVRYKGEWTRRLLNVYHLEVN